MSMPKKRLLDQVRDILPLEHLSRSTEKASLYGIKRFILFREKRHPRDRGEPEIRDFPVRIGGPRKGRRLHPKSGTRRPGLPLQERSQPRARGFQRLRPSPASGLRHPHRSGIARQQGRAKTTMIDTHVLNRGRPAVLSPLDRRDEARGSLEPPLYGDHFLPELTA